MTCERRGAGGRTRSGCLPGCSVMEMNCSMASWMSSSRPGRRGLATRVRITSGTFIEEFDENHDTFVGETVGVAELLDLGPETGRLLSGAGRVGLARRARRRQRSSRRWDTDLIAGPLRPRVQRVQKQIPFGNDKQSAESPSTVAAGF